MMKNKKAVSALLTAVFVLFAAALCMTGSKLDKDTEYKKAGKTAWQPRIFLTVGEMK